LKEWFILLKLLLIPAMYGRSEVYITKESVALFQVTTDEHWGVDCSKLIEAISVHDFHRHFQIARSTAFRGDSLMVGAVEWTVADKTGNIQGCIEINDKKYRAMELYMRAAPPPFQDMPYFLTARGAFVGVEAHHQHLQPRQNITGALKYMGINNAKQAEEGFRSSAEWVFFRSTTSSSADGLAHLFPEHMFVALIRAVLSLSAVGTRNVELSWLDELPPADATTLHCTALSNCLTTTVRTLVAEVFEQQGRHADAILFVQTDLQDYHNLNVPSKVRAGQVLGRCHTALGQHMLSVSAFDSAIELAQSRKLLLSEALSVRGRAVVGRNTAGGSELHWDESTGKQRLVEVMGRMQGLRGVLERVLLLP
jgi:hypothetical protein